MANNNTKSEAIIEVDAYQPDGRHWFYPGQKVTGKVTYIIRKPQEELNNITLEFDGEMLTHVVERTSGSDGKSDDRHYEEPVSLFFFHQTLHQGNYTVKAQTFVWPFEFRFPDASHYERVSRDDSNFAKGSFTEEYNMSRAQPLPASYSVSGLSNRGRAHVEYRLIVRTNQESMFHHREWKMELALRRPPSQAPPAPRIVQNKFPRTTWKSRDLRPQQHSFRQKMAHVFTNDPSLRTPSINLDAWVQMPIVSGAQQRSDITLCLEHIITGPTDPEKVTFNLRRVIMTLQTFDKLRAKISLTNTTWKSMHSDGTSIVSVGVFQPFDSAFAQKPLPLDGSPFVIARNWCLWDLQNKERDLVPDFKTWTIIHMHALELDIELVHAETGHVFHVNQSWSVSVLPDGAQELNRWQLQPGAAPTRTLPAATAVPPEQWQREEEEQLPAYSPMTGPSGAVPPPPK